MQTMNARVPMTDQASRYLKRLCKHFSHKVPARWDDSRGEIDFPLGKCRLEATESALLLQCEAADGERLGRLGEVVASHLERFVAGASEGDEVRVVWHES